MDAMLPRRLCIGLDPALSGSRRIDPDENRDKVLE